jgi:hypothetical protein
LAERETVVGERERRKRERCDGHDQEQVNSPSSHVGVTDTEARKVRVLFSLVAKAPSGRPRGCAIERPSDAPGQFAAWFPSIRRNKPQLRERPSPEELDAPPPLARVELLFDGDEASTRRAFSVARDPLDTVASGEINTQSAETLRGFDAFSSTQGEFDRNGPATAGLAT